MDFDVKSCLIRCVKLLHKEGLLERDRRNLLIYLIKKGDKNAYHEVSYRLGFLATVALEEGKRIGEKQGL